MIAFCLSGCFAIVLVFCFAGDWGGRKEMIPGLPTLNSVFRVFV